jgi:hypothetical protein
MKNYAHKLRYKRVRHKNWLFPNRFYDLLKLGLLLLPGENDTIPQI